ncbi:AbiH family protein [Acinetobacter baumannii]|uniref:AbiH family protein n=1 Tax=Acinetobacter baumannii TaxID=470 RepID=UPI0022B34989|nr:AbiH family protein [Acinetobacter baumannii]MDC4685626.1 bacteriophage abortive infection AbiH family protein [Acinetobacter baumannii]
MNILIIGNGFDLSHFLPTKYDHFMEVMKHIQNFSTLDENMYFQDLFEKLIIKESFFFKKTQELYECSEISIDKDEIEKFQVILNNNVWYDFFLDHVNEIKTWIDFEQKIEEALLLVVNALQIIEEYFLKNGKFNLGISKNDSSRKDTYFFPELQFHLLVKLGIFNLNEYRNAFAPNGKICPDFFKVSNNEKYGLDSKKYLSFLQKQLDDFIILFNLYLTNIINKFKPKLTFKIKDFDEINSIYSFNYTNTFEKFYSRDTKIHYLHGRFGEEQNLVLGISDLTHDSLINLRVYGFTKYHQKLLKNTDYSFLHDILSKYNNDKKELEDAIINLRSSMSDFTLRGHNSKIVERKKNTLSNINLNFYIWGHSLDVSDENYIKEIFSFNEEMDNNVRVIIFHYDKFAKFDLLANLIHILKKEKVELWMKNGWLIFKNNPEIIQNTI